MNLALELQERSGIAMRQVIRFVIVGTLAVGAVSSTAAADAERGKTLFATCAACHGATGEGNLQFNAPKLAGQEPWFIERQLLNFQKGIRGTDAKDLYGMQMRPLASTLDAAGVQDVSAYLSSLPWVGAESTVEGDAAQGKAHYATCVACHGEKGQGNPALNAPRIAGQEDWYLIRQLKNFASGSRGSHPEDLFGAQMRPMAMSIAPNPNDDSALRDLASYVNTLD